MLVALALVFAYSYQNLCNYMHVLFFHAISCVTCLRLEGVQRPMMDVNRSLKGARSADISLVSYNVLAQSLIMKNLHLYRHLKTCPELLEWDYRKHNLLQELLRSRGNVRMSQDIVPSVAVCSELVLITNSISPLPLSLSPSLSPSLPPSLPYSLLPSTASLVVVMLAGD